MKKIINLKKVISLTKVLCKDYFENLPINKSKNSTQGVLFKICLLIATIGLIYISYYAIDFLKQTGQPEIFLNAYLLIMGIIIIFQQIIASTNIYYFSKDLEYILPYPIKPVELLIARFNMLITISYTSILMFVLAPLLIYGMIAATSLTYFLGMIIVLITFPIFFGIIISIVMLFIIQLTKIIKNKDIFQFIATTILTWILMTFAMQAITSIFSNVELIEQIQQGESINLIEKINNKIENINNYLITINPSVKILTENNILIKLFELIKILLINILSFLYLLENKYI